MTTDTKLKELIINKLTTSQYDSIEEKDPNQIYIVTDAPGFDNTITNCLTHIPQDVKLELNNGTLTLKAGSKVYVPNGVGKFDEVVISSDKSYTNTNLSNIPHLAFIDTAGNLRIVADGVQTHSGATAPTVSATYMLWYDTTNNLVKYSTNSGASYYDDCSLPIAVLGVSGNKMTSIDQTFNGFGYIGSTVFALPGVKGLIPNGRNADGTLKNTEFTVSSVLTHTRTTSLFGAAKIILKQNQIRLGDYIIQYNYDEQENKFYYTPFMDSSWCDVGTYLMDGTTVTSFTLKTTFHAVDYNDVPKLNGKNTFNGENTFTNLSIIKRPTAIMMKQMNTLIDKTVVPSANQHVFTDFLDKNNSRLGVIGARLLTNGYYGVYMQAGNEGAIAISYDGTSVFTFAPTPPTSDNSTQIATTAWVNTRLGGTNVTSTELGYLDGVTSAIQTQLNNRITASVSKAQNGYIKFSNGIIIQWGTVGVNVSGFTTFTFPTSFTSTNYRIIATPLSSASNIAPAVASGVYNKTTTNCGVGLRQYSGQTHGVASVEIIAIGY